MKRIIALLLTLLLLIPAGFSLAEGEKTLPSVAIVVAGGLGDRSFYDSANEGLQKLMAEYGLEGRVVECKNEQAMIQPNLVSAAEISDIVVAVGWEFYDALQEVAPAMPDTKFIYVDEYMEGFDNLLNITYSANEGSFLVGYVAGMLSESHKVGAVGGTDSDVINDFLVGYRQGAQYANPETQVEFVYTEDYEDPTKGKEAALSLYDKGCDIVFAVAGKTGEGVFEAASERGKYAIGVDTDQKYINPDVIICSMIKRVGDSIYTGVKQFIDEGVFDGGAVWLADMETGFIDIGYGTEDMPQQVPDELKILVEEIRGKIIGGEIVVETTRE